MIGDFEGEKVVDGICFDLEAGSDGDGDGDGDGQIMRDGEEGQDG